jgi:hypothetical protein
MKKENVDDMQQQQKMKNTTTSLSTRLVVMMDIERVLVVWISIWHMLLI